MGLTSTCNPAYLALAHHGLMLNGSRHSCGGPVAQRSPGPSRSCRSAARFGRRCADRRFLAKPGLVLQPGFTSSPGALAPVAFAGALLVPPAPGRPVLNRLDRRRSLPDQTPQQPPHFRHGEGQQPGGARDRVFSPRWRSGAPPSGMHAPASRA